MLVCLSDVYMPATYTILTAFMAYEGPQESSFKGKQVETKIYPECNK